MKKTPWYFELFLLPMMWTQVLLEERPSHGLTRKIKKKEHRYFLVTGSAACWMASLHLLAGTTCGPLRTDFTTCSVSGRPLDFMGTYFQLGQGVLYAATLFSLSLFFTSVWAIRRRDKAYEAMDRKKKT